MKSQTHSFPTWIPGWTGLTVGAGPGEQASVVRQQVVELLDRNLEALRLLPVLHEEEAADREPEPGREERDVALRCRVLRAVDPPSVASRADLKPQRTRYPPAGPLLTLRGACGAQGSFIKHLSYTDSRRCAEGKNHTERQLFRSLKTQFKTTFRLNKSLKRLV